MFHFFLVFMWLCQHPEEITGGYCKPGKWLVSFSFQQLTFLFILYNRYLFHNALSHLSTYMYHVHLQLKKFRLDLGRHGRSDPVTKSSENWFHRHCKTNIHIGYFNSLKLWFHNKMRNNWTVGVSSKTSIHIWVNVNRMTAVKETSA